MKGMDDTFNADEFTEKVHENYENIDIKEVSKSWFRSIRPPLPKKWEHDCDHCIYLGTMNVPSSYLFDLEGKLILEVIDFYRCENTITGTTYLARRSSEGPDYSSWPESVLRCMKNPTDHITSILVTEYKIDNAKWKSKHRFCLEFTGQYSVEILISKLISEEQDLYLRNAINHCESYRPLMMDSEACRKLIQRIDELMEHQNAKK